MCQLYFTKVSQLLVCGKCEVALPVLFYICSQETIWYMFFLELEIQIVWVAGSLYLSQSIGCPRQVFRF